MNGKDVFWGLKYIGTDLVEEAEYGTFSALAENNTSAKQHSTIRRPLLIAAIIAMTLLLVGCTVAAYTQGWFPGIFAAHSESPLSDSQIEFIENNE